MKYVPTFLAIICLSVLCACSGKSTPVSVSGMYYDTLVNIDIYGSGSEATAISDECRKMCAHYEQLFDKNIPGSDIYNINHSNGQSVRVDHDTALMLTEALSYARSTDGLFDPTIEPLSSLWDFHEENIYIPSDDEIGSLLALVDYRNISVDISNDTVTAAKGTSIDPGAAGKGFIADRIGDYLLTCPITGAVINMGGDIRVIGTKPDRSAFHIGINDPFNEGSISSSLDITDMAVATSGIYERCFTENGRTYHHILDPSTGYPADTDIESVTVICKKAVDADCLCTVSILYGSQKAVDLIEKTKDTEAVIILTDKTLIKTSGVDKYIRQ